MKMLAGLFALLLSGSGVAVTKWGEKVAIGNGYARTFVKLNGKKAKELGIALSHTALSGLSHEMAEYVLPLPVALRPYKHVTMDWNPHGHEPDNVYTKPHFDAHFYFIKNSTRQRISCLGDDAAVCLTQPAPDTIAANYAPTPAGVPKMGWHWVDLLSPEFNGGIFTKTFLYGYYNGNMIFLEPMVTLEYLKSKKSAVSPVRLPKKFPYQGGNYPQAYRVHYDGKSRLHLITLENLN